MRVLLRRDRGWEAMSAQPYGLEDELQRLLIESPETLLAGPSDAPATVYCREFPSDTGPIDLLGVASDGSISLVECKLAKNAEIKRKVVGQVLDYAAALWRMPASEFETRFQRVRGESPFALLRGQSGEDWDEQSTRATVESNLMLGRFRLVIAADRLNDDLRRIVEYVNAQPGRLRLVALTFPRFAHGVDHLEVSSLTLTATRLRRWRSVGRERALGHRRWSWQTSSWTSSWSPSAHCIAHYPSVGCRQRMKASAQSPTATQAVGWLCMWS